MRQSCNANTICIRSPQFLHDSHVAVHPVQTVRIEHVFEARDAADHEFGQAALLVPRHEREVVAEDGGVLQDAPVLQFVATLAAVRGTALVVEELGQELEKGARTRRGGRGAFLLYFLRNRV